MNPRLELTRHANAKMRRGEQSPCEMAHVLPAYGNEIVDQNTFLQISQNAISVLFFCVRRDACRQF
jgi:hypothetical protein